jgi:hypothetical protein
MTVGIVGYLCLVHRRQLCRHSADYDLTANKDIIADVLMMEDPWRAADDGQNN